MYFNKLSSLMILLITVEISIARTLHRRFDINEFLTPSRDEDEAAKSNQAKASAATQESDFEYEGFHGIVKQTQDATAVATNQIATASANIGVAGGGVLANVAYQLLNFTQKGIKYVGGGTVKRLEKMQQKSWSTKAKDAISNTGDYIVGRLDEVSGILDDVAKMSEEQEVVQQEHKKSNKKNRAMKDGKEKKKKKKKKEAKEVKDGGKKTNKEPREVKAGEQKKKKKRTEKVVDENLIINE